MADTEDVPANAAEDQKKKGSKKPLILGLILAVLGGGGGFFAVQSGVIGGSSGDSHESASDDDHGGGRDDGHDDGHGETAADSGELAFVPLDTLVINLPAHAQTQHLLFTAQLEVNPMYTQDVTSLKPRIVDVLNGYLRSVDLSELEDPTALIRLRAQMLRRVQVVVGEGRVRDVLIMEFVLN